MPLKGLISPVLVFLLSFGAQSPLASRHPQESAPRPFLTAARAGEEEPGKDDGEGKDEGKDDEKGSDEDKGSGKGGDEGGKDKAKDKDEAKAKPEGKAKPKAEGKKSGLPPEKVDELKAIRDVIPPDEVDQKSPRFIVKSRDSISLVMTRPPVPKAGKAPEKTGKKVVLDGSRWGFVDREKRRMRLTSFYDKLSAAEEKLANDESLSEGEREEHRKQYNAARAEKSRKMTELDRNICLVELVGGKQALRVYSQDRPNGVSEKAYRDALRGQLSQKNFNVTSEREEKKAGNRMPGYTFIAEGGGGTASEPVWKRLTYFVVPRPKGPAAMVIFDCETPKSAVDEQFQQEVDFLIKGTSFN